MSEANSERPQLRNRSIERFNQAILSPEDIQQLKENITETLKSEKPDSKYQAADQLSHLKRAGIKVKISEKLCSQLEVERNNLKNDPQKLAKYLVRLKYLRVMQKEEVTSDEKKLITAQIEQAIQDPDTKNFAEICVNARGAGVEIPPAAKEKIKSEIASLSQQAMGNNIDHYVKRLAQARYLDIGLKTETNLTPIRQLTKERLANHAHAEDWSRFARLQSLYTKATDRGLPVNEAIKGKLAQHTFTLKDNPAQLGHYLGDLRNIEQSLSSTPASKPPRSELGLDLGSNRSQEKAPFRFRYMRDPEQRRILAKRVMDLVDEAHNKSLDTVVFLDKSARPLSTLFRDLWKKKFKNEQPPNVNFLNVGTETVNFLEDRLASTHPEILSKSSEDSVEERGILDGDEFSQRFSPEETLALFNPAEIERVRSQYRDLQEAKRIMIIDDVSLNGNTLTIAEKIVEGLSHDAQLVQSRALRSDSSFDRLFRTAEGIHVNPPWRKLPKTDDNRHGVTGVVDRNDQGISLTAQPSARNNPKLMRKIQKLREEMHAVAEEYWINQKQNKLQG